MPHPRVTIRHLRAGIHLLISGAVRDIEAEFGSDDDAKEMVAKAFDEAADELDDWDMPTQAGKQNKCVKDMQAMLGEPDCPMAVRELLVKYDLLP